MTVPVNFLTGLKGSAISVSLLQDAPLALAVVYAPMSEDRGADCIAWAGGIPARAAQRSTSHGRSHPAAFGCACGRHGEYGCGGEAAPQRQTLCTRPAPWHAEHCQPPMSADDVVAGHSLLRASGGVLFDQDGRSVSYRTEFEMAVVARRFFGGALRACLDLSTRD
jgi:myo-inositol-1(or 4)-monophosphatase